MIMKPSYLPKVKEAVGHEKLSVLIDVFRNSKGTPPGVPAARYRADHPSWIDGLGRLESDQLFLRRDRSSQNYQVRVYTLSLLEDEHARELVTVLNEIFPHLKAFYARRLSEPVKVNEIAKLVSAGEALVREALYYLTDSHGVWGGLSNNFPYGDESYMCIAESILKYDDFDSLTNEFYDWHFINPKIGTNPFQMFGDGTSAEQAIQKWGDRPTTRLHWLIGVVVALVAIVVAILLKFFY
jgi:hypothetical protein